MVVCRHFSLCSSRAPITLEFPILSESPSANIEKTKIPFKIRRAHFDDLAGIQLLLKPFVEQRKLLRRMQGLCRRSDRFKRSGENSRLCRRRDLLAQARRDSKFGRSGQLSGKWNRERIG